MLQSLRIIVPAMLVCAGVSAAAAEVEHRFTTPQGEALKVNYRPDTSLKVQQRGLGPREMPRCAWKASYRLERTVTAADGTLMAQLSRVTALGEDKKGITAGSCESLRREMEGAANLPSEIRALVETEASRDFGQFQSEISRLTS